jgi:hypothetical protein
MLDSRLLYLEHLSDRDIEALFGAADVDVPPEERRTYLRRELALIDRLLGDERLFELIFGDGEFEVRFSPFLVFGAIVHRAAAELERASFVNEWTGPRQRLPVFDVEPLRRLLGASDRRYFLTELLASFTKVASGSYWTRTRRGLRRRRFSELDPLQLVELAEGSPAWRKPGVYRRLGDVSLFLTGVFPDHTAQQTFSVSEAERLARSAGMEPGDLVLVADKTATGLASLGVLELTGPRWYRIAVEGSAAIVGSGPALLDDIAGRFREARRVLNYLTDRYLFRFRRGSLPGPG